MTKIEELTKKVALIRPYCVSFPPSSNGLYYLIFLGGKSWQNIKLQTFRYKYERNHSMCRAFKRCEIFLSFGLSLWLLAPRLRPGQLHDEVVLEVSFHLLVVVVDASEPEGDPEVARLGLWERGCAGDDLRQSGLQGLVQGVLVLLHGPGAVVDDGVEVLGWGRRDVLVGALVLVDPGESAEDPPLDGGGQGLGQGGGSAADAVVWSSGDHGDAAVVADAVEAEVCFRVSSILRLVSKCVPLWRIHGVLYLPFLPIRESARLFLPFPK